MELIVVSADITLCSGCLFYHCRRYWALSDWLGTQNGHNEIPSKENKIEDCYTVDSSNNSHRHQWTALFELPHNLCVYRLS